MPQTEIRAFQNRSGESPVIDWLDHLERAEPKVYAKCLARILELSEKGFDMRRPHADLLRDGVYELRASFRGVHYRILYFFFAKGAVALSHGITKQDKVPSKEIEVALQRMEAVKSDPQRFTVEFTF